MRISKEQSQKIKNIVSKKIGGDAKVWLFGSRVDDNARGGDIDLLISCSISSEQKAQYAASIKTQVMRLFRGRKTDVIIETVGSEYLPIYGVAKTTGIQL